MFLALLSHASVFMSHPPPRKRVSPPRLPPNMAPQAILTPVIAELFRHENKALYPCPVFEVTSIECIECTNDVDVVYKLWLFDGVNWARGSVPLFVAIVLSANLNAQLS